MAPRLGFILTINRRAGNGKDLLPGCPVFFLSAGPHSLLDPLNAPLGIKSSCPAPKAITHKLYTWRHCAQRASYLRVPWPLLFQRKCIASRNVRAWTQLVFGRAAPTRNDSFPTSLLFLVCQVPNSSLHSGAELLLKVTYYTP